MTEHSTSFQGQDGRPRPDADGPRTQALRCTVLLALALVCGCDQSTSPGEEEHAGHVIPAHKPRTFPDAVKSLKELDAAIVKGGTADGRDGQTLEKAIDVAGWLPELAAESDMPEGPWTEVDRLATALVAEYRSRRSAGDPVRPGTTSERHLKELEGIVAASNPAWFDGPAKVRPSAVAGSGEQVEGRTAASLNGEGR